jgi:PST family polysaccharide transporter
VIVSATVLNIALALLLAPRFGALGMAWVAVVAEGFILIGLLWALHRRGLRPIAPSQLRRSFAALLAERR